MRQLAPAYQDRLPNAWPDANLSCKCVSVPFLYVERPPSRLQIDYSHVKVRYGTVTIHLICGTSPESIDPGFNGTESGFNIGKYLPMYVPTCISASPPWGGFKLQPSTCRHSLSSTIQMIGILNSPPFPLLHVFSHRQTFQDQKFRPWTSQPRTVFAPGDNPQPPTQTTQTGANCWGSVSAGKVVLGCATSRLHVVGTRGPTSHVTSLKISVGKAFALPRT